MVLKLYGHPKATCTQRVAVVLIEKRVPFELIEVNFAAKEHKSPEYLAKNPFGKIPCIDDDGFILYESRAISRYIATKWANQGTPLIPSDAKGLALLEQAANIEAFNFDPYITGAIFEKIYKPQYFNGSTDEARLAEYHTKADEALKGYDAILSKQKYIAGDQLTVVDLYHLPYGVLYSTTGSDWLTKYPNVARWLNEISSRPSWLAVKDNIESITQY